MGIIDMIKGIFVAIFVLGLITAVPLLIMSNSVKSTLFQPTFYETQLEKVNAYQTVQTLLLDMAVNVFPKDQLNTMGVTSTELRAAFAKQFTTNWVKTETNRMTKSLVWYITDQTQGYNLSLSIKPKVSGAMGELVAAKLGISASDAADLISVAMGDQLPDPIDLSAQPGVKSGLAQAKSAVSMFMSVSGLLLIAIIGLLVLIFLFKLDLPGFAAVIGWPLLVVGISTAATAFFLPSMLSSTLGDAVKGAQTGTQLSSAAIVQMVVDFIQPLFSDMLMQSIMLIVVSVVLIALSFAWPMLTKGNDKGKKK